MFNCERAAFKEIDIPARCQLRTLKGKYNGATHLSSFDTPFGATLSSSSAPKIFCLSPLGWHSAFPKNLTNSGAEITLRNRRELRWMLVLSLWVRKTVRRRKL